MVEIMPKMVFFGGYQKKWGEGFPYKIKQKVENEQVT
jgi:hypothetical protein